MQKVAGLRERLTAQEQHFLVEALKLLTGLQRQLIEVKQTLEVLMKS